MSLERQAWGEPGVDADYVIDNYTCISGLFKASEKEVRDEIAYIIDNDFEYNIYGIKRENPYDGLFIKESRFFRYTINHSKKEFFDIENTRLTYTNEDGVLTTRINPLPLLMAFPGSPSDRCTGLWIGDQIEVSDTAPPSGYDDKSEEYGWDM